jgi:uncharacterized protein (TIGR03032 family)
MQAAKRADAEGLWAHHHAEHRDPHQIVSQWREAGEVDPVLLAHRVRGDWWDIVQSTGLTLFLTREYEHLVLALSCSQGKKRISYLQLPHPSGLAVEPGGQRLHIASTRNPNVVFTLAPCTGRVGQPALAADHHGQMLPVRAQYLPGCIYTHDIAFIGGRLHANAVGMNAVVRLEEGGGFTPVWWPACIDSKTGPRFDRNYIQLNSIAAGKSLEESFFSASVAAPSRRRPGHLNWAVDRRGVIFSGRTREVVGRGLTRPHSARLRNGEIWVDNSGYGELGRIVDGKFDPVLKLPGWTRGLFFHGDLAFVGTSRVIPKYRHYAPGLDPDRCESALHAVDIRKGVIVGSMSWPAGNQIFAIEGLPSSATPGFPFSAGSKARGKRMVELFFRGVGG